MKTAIIDSKTIAKPMSHHHPKNDFLSLEDLNSKVSTNGWAVIFFCGYLILGILYYCYSDQQLTSLDAVYLAVITFATVGYGKSLIFYLELKIELILMWSIGDVPTGNRYFATFYVLLGAGLVGSFFGIFSNDVMEAQEAAMQQRLLGVAKSMDKLISGAARKADDYRKNTIRDYFK